MENSLTSLLRSASGRLKKSPSGVLPKSFYERDTLIVARELLGKLLMVRSRAGVTVARIVETEAYSQDDPASHSCRGETPRAAVMFGEAGHAYVYFIYGMYEMLNFVTEPKGKAGAVLIRAVEPVAGEELMQKRRKVKKRHDLTCGPGRLCVAMGVQMSHNRQSLAGPALYVIDDGYRPERIMKSRRVGITQATEKDWRFFIANNSFVSRVRENKEAL